ncbi:carboxy-S-adenosyl-L-methionine synthase CmoA [Pseudomonas asuensis]|jgi:tRNA (cmo5U34)-methyltransferase|uniref:Carboxy-S-adenosyl-L-methionine synthase n=1 Tax=Pseudomonas asuensis TaxID=1825787 RepID=A0ABQ2H2D3_9PSED|nr:carboxy-S-adenosyl-L-methionine synthase CmoA [Pseudomonas asuensis]GGM24990.1 carboxy-S-adenosyl-L-methionine synthase [Pseudomonas asuensis]
MSEQDHLFAQPQAKVADFIFNENVARVFPDMIKRSVPGYPTIVENIGVIAAQFAQPNTVLYDLGCSLGAVSQSLRRHVQCDSTKIIAVDNSTAMIQRCDEYMSAQSSMYEELQPIEVIEADILSLDLLPASVVALNFTLQFIDPEKRLSLLRKIHSALHPKGALLLSEKIRFESQADQTLLNDLHIAFKRANGYSEMEIAQKRSALENVMMIDSIEVHRQRLQEAGFTSVTPWFQCFNFASFVALP